MQKQAIELAAALDRIDEDVRTAPASIEIIIGARYVVGALLQQVERHDEAVVQLDRGLQWCGYRLARTSSIESLLPLVLEVARMRAESLVALDRVGAIPVAKIDESDPISASERGFVLAATGMSEPLATWLADFRRRWSDPRSREMADRIAALHETLH